MYVSEERLTPRADGGTGLAVAADPAGGPRANQGESRGTLLRRKQKYVIPPPLRSPQIRVGFALAREGGREEIAERGSCARGVENA